MNVTYLQMALQNMKAWVHLQEARWVYPDTNFWVQESRHNEMCICKPCVELFNTRKPVCVREKERDNTQTHLLQYFQCKS